MKNYLLALAAVSLVALPNCGGSSCCKKGDTSCKQEEVCTQPAAEQMPAQEATRESGPLSPKEVGFTEEDRK